MNATASRKKKGGERGREGKGKEKEGGNTDSILVAEGVWGFQVLITS